MLGIHPNLQGDPKPEQCPGDLDDTGSVGVPDLLALLSCWGTLSPGCEDADITNDGSIGVPDLLELLAAWGACE